MYTLPSFYMDGGFFCGLWCPGELNSADLGQFGRHVRLQKIASQCAVSPGSTSSPVPDDTDVLLAAFRGYLLNASLSTFSSWRDLDAYWQRSYDVALHNGVFSAALLRDGGRTLALITDAFGIGPLYYRTLGDGRVAFSNSPALLRRPYDHVDSAAARIFIHRGALVGDCSLVPNVCRVSPGCTVEFSASGMRQRPWFDYRSFPEGTEPLTPSLLQDIECAFQNAIERCLLLRPLDGPVYLPLSAGDDSRRILAGLLARDIDIEALTVRVFQKGARDLDARFSRVLSDRFGFRHRIVDLPPAAQYVRDALDVYSRMSGESLGHSWVPSLTRAMAVTPAIAFDGLAGDIFGNTGYGDASLYDLTGSAQLERLTELAVPEDASAVLRPDALESLQSVRRTVAQYYCLLPPSNNLPDLAFLLSRARSDTGLVGQWVYPAGILPVYPYLDLEFAAQSLRPRPTDKLSPTLQCLSLRTFSPAFFEIPGSRRFDAGDVLSRGTALDSLLDRARLEALITEPLGPQGRSFLSQILTRTALVRFKASRMSMALAYRERWWLESVYSVAARLDGSAAAH